MDSSFKSPLGFYGYGGVWVERSVGRSFQDTHVTNECILSECAKCKQYHIMECLFENVEKAKGKLEGALDLLEYGDEEYKELLSSGECSSKEMEKLEKALHDRWYHNGL